MTSEAILLKAVVSQVLVAHTCNPSHLGECNPEDRGSRPAQANISQDPISKVTRAKWTGGMAQAAECLLCKYEALSLSSNPSPTKKKKKDIVLVFLLM
jgi:hypothetical protein